MKADRSGMQTALSTIFISVLLMSAHLRAQDRFNSIFFEITPEVTVSEPNRSGFARKGEFVPANATIKTNKQGIAEIKHFTPTYKVRVEAGTRIETDSNGTIYKHNTGTIELKGDFKGRNNNGFFIITPQGVLYVDQTHWIQEIGPDGLTIIVLEGVIRFKNDRGEYVITAGKRMTVADILSRPEIKDIEDFIPNGSRLELRFRCEDGSLKTAVIILDKK
jgi:hypothetical protein